MHRITPIIKLFGAALDAMDDPDRVGLKHAYLQARAKGRIPVGLPADPYDALAPSIAHALGTIVSPSGKLEIPGWLTPRPQPEHAPLVRSDQYRAFIDAGKIRGWIDACSRFVERNILPDIPCMIAVDHAMTTGPLRALAARHGPEALTVVVLDSHFDAIPAHLRMPSGSEGHPPGVLTCGNFLAALLDDGILLPSQLFVIGVSDFPVPGTTTAAYEEAYLTLVRRGVHIFPGAEAEHASFPARLSRALTDSPGKHLYVSLDTDVGACTCMNAVRFLDARGMPEAALLNVATLLGRLFKEGVFELAGVDIAEVDVHLLGLHPALGEEDRTAQVCVGFLRRLLL